MIMAEPSVAPSDLIIIVCNDRRVHIGFLQFSQNFLFLLAREHGEGEGHGGKLAGEAEVENKEKRKQMISAVSGGGCIGGRGGRERELWWP